MVLGQGPCHLGSYFGSSPQPLRSDCRTFLPLAFSTTPFYSRSPVTTSFGEIKTCSSLEMARPLFIGLINRYFISLYKILISALPMRKLKTFF